jgi:hypothetical protein
MKTPGVYINESEVTPNPVIPIATSVPAFIGYTPQASYEGKSYTNKPTKVSSFAEFKAIFCFEDPAAPAAPAQQYKPEYYLMEAKTKPEKGDYIFTAGAYYSILPDPSSIYYFYNSIKLFYENGGGDAYIVSVGGYGPTLGSPIKTGEQIVNPNVKLDELLKGLEVLKNESEPTMYICPDATLLSLEDNGTLMQAMLLQNTEMETAIRIFDIIGGNTPDPILYTQDIENFRNNTGSDGLKFGTAYYPFIGTTIMQSSDIYYTSIFGGDVKQLLPILSPTNEPNAAVEKIITEIEQPSGSSLTIQQADSALLNASKTYSEIKKHILAQANIMPASGGMAGVITVTDNQIGPWKSPANISIVSATSLPIKLSSSQQENLNIDAVSGKSINAIRFFNGQGILVWGARTLDGNSQDWRYLSVRRTVTYIEQSCKLAANAYVFEANDKNTWLTVKATIESFLTNVWKQGGLQGASANDAFSVQCGLGTTMTSQDILDGYLKVSVRVAVVRPAEFIVITIQQEMAKS